jgi:DNA modification methylase
MASISDLQSDHKNARKRTDRSATLIEESLKRYGAARSVVIDEDNRILAGNGTVDAAKRAGISKVRVIETDGDEIIAVKRTGLTEDQKIGLALADNRTSDLSEWDKEMLHQLSEEHDITPWFEAEDLAEIMGEVEVIPPEGLTDADDVPEVPEEPVTKLGDVWLLGKHRVMCGDSTAITDVEQLMAGAKADMVFTDPPYGVDYDGGHATEKRREKLQNDDDVNMYDLPIKNAFIASNDDAALYLWFSDSYASEVITGLNEAGYQVRSWIIWNKNVAQFGAIGAQYKMKHEPCIYAFKKGKAPNWDGPTNEVTIWDVARDHRNEHHPTQKPTALAERAMGNHRVKLVLDLFGGSGSTLIACEKTGRQARLMELDPRYCDVIVKRWEDFTGKKAILEESQEAY